MSEEKPAPLLSDADLRHIDDGRFAQGRPMFTREDMRDFYEAKITSGELMVVKTAQLITLSPDQPGWYHCSLCNYCVEGDSFNFCPGCGAKIIKS